MAKHKPGATSACPHCRTAVRYDAESNGSTVYAARAPKEALVITPAACTNCGRLVITIEAGLSNTASYKEVVVWPRSTTRDPVPTEVPPHIAADYVEAADVLEFSAKASAALSRRCLQVVLKEAGGTKERDLARQIEEVAETLPLYLQESLDAVRNIGNFAAHQQKSTTTGAILDVEPQEAEWNLDVLDALFDFYYVQPAKTKRRRDALNSKLSDAGKPTLK